MENLTGRLSDLETVFAEGGFGLLRKATLSTSPDTTGAVIQVAVKFPNLMNIDSSTTGGGGSSQDAVAKASRRWGREILAGMRVSHPNILPFLGLCDNPCDRYREFVGIVLPYCANGDASSYTRVHPEVDRLQIVCGVASALFALHTSSPPVVHGDIKAANILIGDDGRALLADFGLSRVCEARGFTTECVKGSWRWMAIELLMAQLDDKSLRTTTASDIWGFAMTILEILTGHRPYAEITHSFAVVAAVAMRDARPERPCNPHITDAVWTLLQQCWEGQLHARPDARHVGLVLDVVHGSGGIPGSATVSDISNGELDTITPPKQGQLEPDLRLMPYKCKWLNCSQSFVTMEECIDHECTEFERRRLASHRN